QKPLKRSLLFGRKTGRLLSRSLAPYNCKGKDTPAQQNDDRRSPQQDRPGGKARLQQYELTIARDNIVDDLLIRVARSQPFTNQNPQVTCKLRIRIVDRLVLTDHAPQTCRQFACSGFEHRVVKDLVWRYRSCEL